MSCYSIMRKQQKKYYKKIFRHFLDQCLFNAYVYTKKTLMSIQKKNKNKKRRTCCLFDSNYCTNNENSRSENDIF